MGLDLKPARSGIAQNYDSETGEPAKKDLELRAEAC